MTFGEEGWGEKQSDREREVEREKRVKNRDREQITGKGNGRVS